MRRVSAIIVFCLFLLVAFVLWRRHENGPELPAKDPAITAPTTPLAAPPAPRVEAKKENPLALVAARKKSATLSPAEIEQARGNAKVALAANYAAQKSFFSEYHRYSTDFGAVGWEPYDLPLSYKAGFLTPYYPAQLLPSEDPRRMDTDALLAAYPAGSGGPFYTPAGEAISLTSLSGYCRAGCTASEHGFEMLVAFNLDADSTLEVWRINEKKELEQVVNDLAE